MDLIQHSLGLKREGDFFSIAPNEAPRLEAQQLHSLLDILFGDKDIIRFSV
jgi:hypothetical protein